MTKELDDLMLVIEKDIKETKDYLKLWQRSYRQIKKQTSTSATSAEQGS